MRITQGAFSYLPDLTDEQIAKQVQYLIENRWAVSIEHTDDPNPYNVYWEMFGMPMFDLEDAAGVMHELAECRRTFPNAYIRINGFDPSPMWQAQRMSFIAQRPAQEPGFRLGRQVYSDGRRINYSLSAYSADHPSGERYRD